MKNFLVPEIYEWHKKGLNYFDWYFNTRVWAEFLVILVKKKHEFLLFEIYEWYVEIILIDFST